MEINYGKGAIQTPKEIRDRQFRLGATPSLIDWSKPYHVPATLHQRDQKSSSSCTGQATCYYCEVLNQIENQTDEKDSARFLYSQSYLPGGGAYIWKPMAIAQKPGLTTEVYVPDGDSSEATMTDQSLNSQALIESMADKYAVIPRSNIDQMAQVVRDYHGFVTGFNGRNDMFSPDGTANLLNGSPEWGHAVYVCGYEMRNGKKCLKFKNSWSINWGDGGYGYFPEEFVNSGMMFDCYVFADIIDLEPMNPLVMVEGQKDIWLVRDGKRSLVYNLIAFQLLGGNIDQVQKLTQAQLNAIPDSGLVLAGLPQE